MSRSSNQQNPEASTVAPVVVVGVTGSIAAHKAIDLVSLLTRAGADVHVILTRAAQQFVQPLPFQTLSRNPVVTDLFAEQAGWQPTHIELADAARLLLIAPATAHVIAKLALGLADDTLSSVALALNPETPILIAPAMNSKMWRHPATQNHVQTLRQRGVEFIGPEEGPLACGYTGPGRLADVQKIARRALELLGISYNFE